MPQWQTSEGPRQQADTVVLSRLRPGFERRGKGPSQRGQQEAAAIHAGMVGQAQVRSQRRRSGDCSAFLASAPPRAPYSGVIRLRSDPTSVQEIQSKQTPSLRASPRLHASTTTLSDGTRGSPHAPDLVVSASGSGGRPSPRRSATRRSGFPRTAPSSDRRPSRRGCRP
jgi:hypothetical protein